jgi:hypothetical protein
MKDLTLSNIDRQNILNNRGAIEKLQEYLGLEGMLFKEQYKFTMQQIVEFYVVDRATIQKYLTLYENELKHNGYEVLKGSSLKEFKKEFGHILEEGAKAPQLGVFNFRALLNLGMLLVESEKAKILRSKMLDIVIDSINNRLGGSSKYINQRDEDFFNTILKEPTYRKKFTSALSRFVEMDSNKYSYFTDLIYTSIFKENAKEYKQILSLEETENPRDTMYAEILRTISSFEAGVAYEIEKKSKEQNSKLNTVETEKIITEFSNHPQQRPYIEDACTKMATRDYGFKQVVHEKLKNLIQSIPESDYERFLGEKSKTMQERIEENKDVFERLKER